MGWFGYKLYDGDGTQTCHLDFLKRAKIAKNSDVAFDMMMHKGSTGLKTIIPQDKKNLLKKNIALVLKKMPRWKEPRKMEECDLIEWQMLLALFIDNDIKPTKEVLKNGIEATKELCYDHADDFDYPNKRKKVLKDFIKKAEKLC